MDILRSMTVVRYRPGAPLADYVQSMWWSHREVPQVGCEHMLPSASTQMIFALHDGAYSWKTHAADERFTAWTRGIIHGPQWSYFVSGSKPIGAVAGVSFRAGTAGALLGLPASELLVHHLPIDEIWGSDAESIRHRLLELSEPMAILRALEQELLARLTHPLLLHPAIAHALVDPTQGWGFTRIANVQRRSGYSPKHFISLFRNAVGLTPKHYYRIKRFGAALKILADAPRTSLGDGANLPPRANLAELAASAGFADQSHLTREFNALAGVTPLNYRPRSPDSALHHLDLGTPTRGARGQVKKVL